MKFKILLFISFVCISIFGQVQTVTIGTQVWTTKNLDVSTFRNGEIIPEAKTNIEWEAAGDNKQPAWCYYDNNPANGTKYGKLYNWYAVNDPRGLAPEGWHVPTDKEWKVLKETLGGSIRNQLKLEPVPVYENRISYVDEGGYYDENWVYCSNCINWNSEYKKKVPCHICKDERGKFVKGKYIPKTKKRVEEKIQIGGWEGETIYFSEPAGGIRNTTTEDNPGYFYFIGDEGFWWSSTAYGWDEYAYYQCSHRYSDYNYYYFMDAGVSVRCLKD